VFSTGHSIIDDFVGGARKGDSLLLITERRRLSHSFVGNIIDFCESHSIPVVSATASDSPTSQFIRLHSKRQYTLPSNPGRDGNLVRSIGRFLQSYGKKSCVVIDDLSYWSERIGDSSAVADIYQRVADFSKDNDSFCMSSLENGRLSNDIVVRLKESATITLEILEKESTLICHPVSLKGRYRPLMTFPIVLKKDALRYSRRLTVSDHRSERDFMDWSGRFAKGFLSAPEPMVVIERTGGVREANERLAGVLGYSRQDLRNIPLLSVIAPNGRFSLLRGISIARKVKRHVFRTSLLTKKGKPVPVEISTQADGRWHFCTISDLSSRKEEAELRSKSEELIREKNNLETILEAHSAAVGVVVGNKIIYVNKSFLHLFGFLSTEQVVRLDLRRLFSAESVKKLRKAWSETGTETLELTAVRRDGTHCEVLCYFSEIMYDGRPAHLLSAREITAEKKNIEDLQSSLAQLAAIAELSDPILVIDEGRCVRANRSFCETFGYKDSFDVVGKETEVVLPSFKKTGVAGKIESVAHGRSERESWEILRNVDGTEFVFQAEAVRAQSGVLVRFRDVTDSTRSHRQVQTFAKEHELLDELISILGRRTEWSTMSGDILNFILQRTPYQSAAMFLRANAGADFTLEAHVALPEKLLTTFSTLPSGEGIGGYLAKTGEPWEFSIEKYPSFLPHRSLFEQSDVHSGIAIPLVFEEHVVGVLLLTSSKKSEATELGSFFKRMGRIIGAEILRTLREGTIRRDLARQRDLVASIPAVLYERSPDGSFQFVSTQIVSLVGYDAREFSRNKSLWLSVVHPDDKKELLIVLANLNDIGTGHVLEYRVLPKGKAEYRTVRDSFSVQKDNDGLVRTLRGILTGIDPEQTAVPGEPNIEKETT
jgi:PAS domain S-box-containing protein